jgi:hypothetical protein
MKKIPSMLFAALLAAVSGIGVGFSSTSSADPGCLGDCFAARYECFAQCGGTTGGCAAACSADHLACRAACG